MPFFVGTMAGDKSKVTNKHCTAYLTPMEHDVVLRIGNKYRSEWEKHVGRELGYSESLRNCIAVLAKLEGEGKA